MNPVQKWQNGLTLTEYEKSVVRNFGYNPDVPFNQGATVGTALQPQQTQPLQNATPTQPLQAPVTPTSNTYFSQPLASAPAPAPAPTADPNQGSADATAGTAPAPAPEAPAAPAAPALQPGYPKPFEGKLYDTPEELASAVHASALVKYNENGKVIEESYKKGLVTYDEYLKLARDNADTVKKTRDQNLSNIQGYFNKIAPDAVQSQQGVMQDTANTDYNKIAANTGDLFGGKGATDVASGDLSSYANDLSTTGKIARGVAGVNDAKTASNKGNTDYMNSVNWDNFAFLNPGGTTADTSLTQFLQNLGLTTYPGQGGATSGVVGQTSPTQVDQFGNPVQKTDQWGNPIK